MRTSALNKWRSDSTASAKRQFLIIRIPLGHAVHKSIAKIITKVPNIELQRIVDVFAKALPMFIDAEKFGPQKRQPKPRQFGPKMAPQFGPKRPPRPRQYGPKPAPQFGPKRPPRAKAAV